jgi:hypothetical protein
MSQRPPASFRNTRKHFLKCVDCGCQTLPQDASKERWGAAASLYINGYLNDGALCFQCWSKRRALLGLPAEQDGSETLTSYDRQVLAPANETLLKKVRVNEQEYSWNVSTLGSLIDKWKDQFFYAEYKKVDTRWWRVVINHRCIPAQDFSSVPISDGDEISIVMGRASTHRMKCHE